MMSIMCHGVCHRTPLRRGRIYAPDGLWGRWVRPGLLVRAPRFRWLVSKIELIELIDAMMRNNN